MAPSATSELVVPTSKVEVAKQPEQHVHGAEDKTPLEAISHGPLIHPGTSLKIVFFRNLTQISGIPTFASHAEHRRHILIHTAAVFRDFSRKGFTEGMR
jgi:hypothetical protein